MTKLEELYCPKNEQELLDFVKYCIPETTISDDLLLSNESEEKEIKL